MSEIDVDQGDEHACHHDGFQHLGAFDEAPGTLQSPEDIIEAGMIQDCVGSGNLERGNISPGRDRWEVELQRLSGRVWRFVH